jgi:nucleoside-diphosphate-sugar epimerase
MISLYGCGFIGRNFKYMYEPYMEIQRRDERKPRHNDILYMISTTHNYHVHDNITLDVDTNLHVLCEVLDHCRSENITFNFISSWFVYGKGITPASETTPCNPQGFYSITKLCAENLIRSFAQTTGMKYRILRLCNVLGQGDYNASKQKNAISWMVNELKEDRDVKVYDHGSHTRDIMHVKDVCRAIKLVMDKGELNETYNIGSGKSTSVSEVLSLAKHYTRSRGELINIETPQFHKVVQGLQHFWMDTSKLKALGFEPHVDLDFMVKDLCIR